MFFDVCQCWAKSIKEEFQAAQQCAESLRANPKAKRLRDNWLRCSQRFEALIKKEPNGPYAAPGLLAAGALYEDLYAISGKTSDRQAALDLYRQVGKRFAKSPDAAKAREALARLGPEQAPVIGAKDRPVKATANKTVSSGSGPLTGTAAAAAPTAAYQKAEACRELLAKSPEKKKFRHQWLRCIEAYEKAAKDPAAGQWAGAAWYNAAQLYADLHDISRKDDDLDSARERFRQAAKHQPRSPYTAKAEAALKALGGGTREAAPETASKSKEPDPVSTAGAQTALASETDNAEGPEAPKAAAGAQALVTGLRFWSNPSYTRVVIDTDREVDFNHRLLKQDPSLDKPQRLYVDLEQSRLGPGIERSLPINDDLLSDARAGQYTADTVRVVVDIKSISSYKVFSMRNPFRIVLDLWGQQGASQTPAAQPTPPEAPSGKPSKDSLARQLALGVRRVVIDPGHGGRDFGAPGAIKGVHEKRIVLEIAKRLSEKIRHEVGCEVLMTRSDDRYLTLEERTAFANTRSADLFISIHTNSARNAGAYGIETYFLNLATDDDAIEVAATENATSTKNISDLQAILNDLMQNAKINESSRLAGHVQQALYGNLKYKYSDIRNKGVKQAPFYVLLGAQMPAILVETSFISHPRECQRLTDPAYQEAVCEAIVSGIKSYIKEINPGAITRHPSAAPKPPV